MLTILDPPAAEPVSVADAKAHLRLTSSSEDGLVSRTIAAAREVIEARTGRALVSQKIRLVLDRAPEHVATLPRGPLVSIDAVEVETADGVWTATDAFAAELGEAARLVATAPWPRPAKPIGGVRIDASVGYGGEGAAPADLLRAVLLLTAHFYERREPLESDRPYALPHSIEALIGGYRRVRL